MKYQYLRSMGVKTVCIGALLGLASKVSAAEFDWKDFTSASAQNWSTNGSWVGGTAPGTSDPTTIIVFDPSILGTTTSSGAISNSFTSTNDVGTVQLNRLTLSGKSDINTARTITISGGTLSFQGSGASFTNTTTRDSGKQTVNYVVNSSVTLGTNTLFDTTGSSNGGTTNFGSGSAIVFDLGSNDLTVKAKPVDIANAGFGAGALVLGTSASNFFLVGSGNIIADTGYFTLNATNSGTYTGQIQIKSGAGIVLGTTVLGNSAAIAANTGAVAVASGGTLSLGNGNYFFSGLTDLSGSGGRIGFGGNTIAGGRIIALSGTGNYTFSGVLQDRLTANAGAASVFNLSLLMTADGASQKLTGANTYTGMTIIGNGTNTQTLEVTKLTDGGVASTTAAALTTAGAVDVQLASVSGFVVGQLVIGNGITEGTTITAINTGTNTITLSQGLAQNTASGVAIKAGTASSIGFATNAAANLQIVNKGTLKYTGAGDSTDHLFTISGANSTVATIDSSGTGALAFTNTGAIAHTNPNSTRTLVLSGSNTGNNTLASTLGNNGTGASSLSKTGAGKWIVTGANTYTGATTVSAGTLLVNGSITSAAVVNTGSFGGTGSSTQSVTIGDSVGAADAKLVTGNSGVGTFTTTGSLQLNSDAEFVFELNSTTGLADMMIASGITLDSLSLFTFVDLGNGSGITLSQVFTLFDNTAGSAISGTFSNLAEGSTFISNGWQYQASYLGGTGNDLTLTVVAAIPEPSTYALLGMGLAVLFVLRRKQAGKSSVS